MLRIFWSEKNWGKSGRKSLFSFLSLLTSLLGPFISGNKTAVASFSILG